MILRGGVLLFLLLAVILTGIYFLRDSQEEEPTLEEIVESKLNAYQTDLVDSMDSFKTNRDVAQYLLAWGKNKGISCSIDSHDNVTFTLKASDDTWKSRKPVVFLCEYNVKSLAVDPEPIAAALTIAKNTKQHGKVKLIFSPSDGIGSSGVSALSASSFTSRTEVFCLGKSAFSKISLETGGYLKFRLSDKLHYQSTSYDKAYRVRISGLPAEKISAYMGSGVNPIKQLGSVLASLPPSAAAIPPIPHRTVR